MNFKLQTCLPAGTASNIQNKLQIPIAKLLAVVLLVFIFEVGCWMLEVPVWAQGQAGQEIVTLKAGVGARPLGMGSAFTAVADNADAPFWNPAGLGFMGKKSEITAMQTKLSTDADHYYLSYVQPALGGTMGISWIQIGTGTLTNTSKEVDINNEVQNISIFTYFSNAFLLAYGKEINERVSAGLSATYLTSDMLGQFGGQAWGYSLTPAVLIKPNQHISIGLKVDDLLNQQSWGTGTIEKVPAKLHIGLAYRSPNPGLFSIDVIQVLRSNYAASASVGYEWEQDGLSLRTGYSPDGVTAGAGFKSGDTRLDYAYVTQSDLSRENVHRISLTGSW